jgi:hypothetical protein
VNFLYSELFLRTFAALSSPDRQTAKRLLNDVQTSPELWIERARQLPPPYGTQSSLVVGDIQVRFKVDIDADGQRSMTFIKVAIVPNYDF